MHSRHVMDKRQFIYEIDEFAETTSSWYGRWYLCAIPLMRRMGKERAYETIGGKNDIAKFIHLFISNIFSSPSTDTDMVFHRFSGLMVDIYLINTSKHECMDPAPRPSQWQVTFGQM